MKSFSIIALALVALVASSSAVPVLNQPADAAELQARIDIYNDFLAGLFSGLVQTTFGSVSNFLNQLITENPLGVGKRDVEQSRIEALTFIYENILQDLFSGLVTNAFGHLSSTLTNLIQTNPLGVGKRDIQSKDVVPVDALSFYYDKLIAEILAALGAGNELAARVDALSFLYDNILSDLFSGLVGNTFSHLSNTLLNLIQTNPLGVGKRDAEEARIEALTFIYENILSDLFSGLVGNTFSHLSNTLLNLIQTNPLGVGKRSVDLQQIQNVLAPIASQLIEKLKKLAPQLVGSLADPTKLAQALLGVVVEIKSAFTTLTQQLTPIVPQNLINEVSHILAAAQSTLVYWASGLGGSLGPVIGPFRP